MHNDKTVYHEYIVSFPVRIKDNTTDQVVERELTLVTYGHTFEDAVREIEDKLYDLMHQSFHKHYAEDYS